MPAKNSSKSMDIQKPGESKPDNSSRPIIVTNRPILQDPMVKESDDEKSDKPAKEKEPASLGGTKVIEPPKGAEEEKVKEDEKPAEEKVEEGSKPLKATDSLPDEPEKEQTKETAVVDAVVAGANRPSEATEAQAIDAADEKRRQAAQVLIDSKKYVVPIGQLTRARHNRHALLLLVFIIAAVAGYLAIDKGLVPVPFEVPINILK